MRFNGDRITRYPSWPLPSSTYPNNCQSIFPSTSHIIRVGFSGGVTRSPFSFPPPRLCSKRGFHNSDIFFGLNEVSNVNRDGVAGVTPNQQNVFSLSTVLGQQVASSSPNTDIFNFLQICWFMYDFEMLLQYTLWDDMVFCRWPSWFKDLKI